MVNFLAVLSPDPVTKKLPSLCREVKKRIHKSVAIAGTIQTTSAESMNSFIKY